MSLQRRVENLETRLSNHRNEIVLLQSDNESEEEIIRRYEKSKRIRLDPKQIRWLVID